MYQITKLPSEILGELINFRGYACAREEAYRRGYAATGSHLSAERMAFGLSVKALTPDQVARYVPIEMSSEK